MYEVQIIDNYSITNNNPETVKIIYPHLFKEVMRHDKISDSSWYSLSDEAYAEYKTWCRNGVRPCDERKALLAAGKKRCGHCRKIKLLSEFTKDKRHRDGLKSGCRNCRSELHKKWYNSPERHQANKEYMRDYARAYLRKKNNIPKEKWRVP